MENVGDSNVRKAAAQAEPGRRAGRRRKFPGASRPITVTLPERTLQGLERIDPDRGHAIVKATDMATGLLAVPPSGVEVVEFERGLGLIVVGPSRLLGRVPGLRMVEVAPGRYLLCIPTGMAVESLEVGILDLLDHVYPEDSGERPMLNRLRELIRNLRQGQAMSKAEIIVVKTR